MARISDVMNMIEMNYPGLVKYVSITLHSTTEPELCGFTTKDDFAVNITIVHPDIDDYIITVLDRSENYVLDGYETTYSTVVDILTALHGGRAPYLN